MKHIKGIKESSSFREDNNFYYIDGINDEDHFLYPVIDVLNNGLQGNNLDLLYDSVYTAFDMIDNGISSWSNIPYDQDQDRPTQILWDFLNLSIEMIDNGDGKEIEMLIHDLVVNCKISK